MKTKVCHLTSAHSRYDVRIFEKECVSLQKKGYDVSLVVNDDKPNEIKNGVTIIPTFYIPKNRVDRMINSTKIVYRKAMEVNAAVYHFHDPELLFVGKKLKEKGKKVIFDAHENVALQIYDKEWIPRIFRKIISSIYSKLESRICKNFDAIITVTPSIVDYYKKINETTILVTNYPIFIDKDINRNSQRQVCFAGSLNNTWSHEIVIKALNNVKGVKYVIAGNIDDSYLKELMSKSDDNLKYIGKISHNQVDELYSKSFAGMALNRSNQAKKSNGTLGNTKIFEYMMNELPVICTNFKLWKEIVEENDCGICVDVDNVEQVENAIRFFLNNSELADRMGKNGRELVRKKYNWELEEKKLFQLYTEVLGDKE